MHDESVKKRKRKEALRNRMEIGLPRDKGLRSASQASSSLEAPSSTESSSSEGSGDSEGGGGRERREGDGV